ncbi:MAG: phenylalanine--tRNA ligase subunit beta, partial [Clostridia bacterium]|nr:phenylalanine--tRNA ligase subunit beta [Clostridia bacterium]
IRSDSSARFEKGVNSYMTRLALARAMQLSQQLGCGTCVNGLIDLSVKECKKTLLTFKYNRIKKLLGITVPKDVVINILQTLGIETTIENNVVCCLVPEYRDDLERDCDIIEEIIRVYGYDHITPTLLEKASITKGGKTKRQTYIDKTKEVLTGTGANEIITYAFFGKSSVDKLLVPQDSELYNLIRITNPLGEEVSYMRTTLVPGMLNILSLNQSRANQSAALFEFGKVFKPHSLPLTELPDEVETLTIGLYGKGDFFLLKGIIAFIMKELGCEFDVVRSKEPFLHPGISADIIVNDEVVGCFGEVHPQVAKNFELSQATYVASIDFDKLSKHVNTAVTYKAIAKFPAVERDLSLVVDDSVAVGDLIKAAKQNVHILEEVKLFDVYKGNQVEQGKKSVSLSFKFRSENKTLTDNEIEKQMKRILSNLQNNFDAKLR